MMDDMNNSPFAPFDNGDSVPEPGRDIQSGRFAKGNQFARGNGNPRAKYALAVREAVDDELPPETIRSLLRVAKEIAMDPAQRPTDRMDAVKECLNRAAGRAPSHDSISIDLAQPDKESDTKQAVAELMSNPAKYQALKAFERACSEATNDGDDSPPEPQGFLPATEPGLE